MVAFNAKIFKDIHFDIQPATAPRYFVGTDIAKYSFEQRPMDQIQTS